MIEAVLFDGDQTLWDFERSCAWRWPPCWSNSGLARPGARADALQIADLQADRNEVAREREGVEFNLARLRRLGFARTLCRLRGVDDASEAGGGPGIG